MPGGLMTLVSVGSENVILNGNPKKTFFKATYNKYTNFGMQRFRIDYNGQRRLHYDQDTEMIFKVPRYADLLGDTYVVVNLPNIWSPLHWQPDASGVLNGNGLYPDSNWTAFDFRWIDNLGAQMIKSVKVYSGGNTLAEYPGEWLYAMQERDFNKGKKNLWDKMVGNIPELNDPARAMENQVYNFNAPHYPSVINDGSCNHIEPSIRGRQLFIPIDAWFCGESKTALPLISIQYQEIYIKITFRPICELFRIRNVGDPSGNLPYITPKLSTTLNNIWRFLSPPTLRTGSTFDASQNFFPDRRQVWDADIHLLSNYYFLSEGERAVFARDDQTYLIKETRTYDYLNVTGSSTIEMDSMNMVASYMWRFRRSDVNLRNEWSNYSNWAYDGVLPVPPDSSGSLIPASGPAANIINSIYYYTCNHPENIREILVDLAIVMDGQYREDLLSSGVWNLVEKYIRTTGNAKNGLYCYNFCLNSNQREYQPSGAMNMNKYKKVQFEFNTVQPPLNPNSPFDVICDASGDIIGVRKEIWRQNNYNYDLRIFEERYNVIVITGGQIGLMLAR
jgi:hypothetical protein